MKTRNLYAKAINTVQDTALSLARGILLLGIIYIILSPFISIIIDAFKHEEDMFNPLVFMIPTQFTIENIRLAFRHMDYINSLTASVILSGGAMLLQLLVCSLTGYGFARFKFYGRELLFAFVIVTIVVPSQSYMVPLFTQFFDFRIFGYRANLLNTYVPVFMMSALGIGLRSGLFIYLFRQFFRGMPKEIEEAARIDGAGWLRTYAGVMLPNATPAILTVSVFSFVWQFNDTFFASMFMQRLNLMPVRLMTLGSYLSAGNFLTPEEINLIPLIVNAGIVLAIAPLVILYFGVQRFFLEGIERSGIVG
jgi:multiple sugar transport system permease protein